MRLPISGNPNRRSRCEVAGRKQNTSALGNGSTGSGVLEVAAVQLKTAVQSVVNVLDSFRPVRFSDSFFTSLSFLLTVSRMAWFFLDASSTAVSQSSSCFRVSYDINNSNQRANKPPEYEGFALTVVVGNTRNTCVLWSADEFNPAE